MKLSDYLQALSLALPNGQTDFEVSRITADSRECTPGTLFLAIQGTQADGHTRIEEAMKAGAGFAIGEKEVQSQHYLKVGSSRHALGILASLFEGNPSHGMLMVGVTGTSGKTTTTYLLEGILKRAGHRVGVIGTVAFRFGTQVYPSTHTTPGAVELQKILGQMRKEGCTAVVMEVSSHSLKQRRLSGVAWDAVGFLNLTPEHLDYHDTLEDYFESKRLLFTECVRESLQAGKSTLGVVVTDSEAGLRLLSSLQGNFRASPETDSWVVNREGISGKAGKVPFQSRLVGRFNAQNISMAVGLTHALGISDEMIASGVESVSVVPGRMESVPNSHGLGIWVDYAHKSDALEKVLKNLQPMRTDGNRLFVLFGCGGDRDRQKRPKMAQIAEKGADRVFVTSDNPRTEDPLKIIEEIRQGFISEKSVEIEPDRASAIERAIRQMKKGDLLVIAGKGHETYQLMGDQRIPFDDREVALQALTRIFKNQ